MPLEQIRGFLHHSRLIRGTVVCLNHADLAAANLPMSFDQSNMPDMRIKICKSIIDGKLWYDKEDVDNTQQGDGKVFILNNVSVLRNLMCAAKQCDF